MTERQAFGKNASHAREQLEVNDRLSQAVNHDLNSYNSIKQASDKNDYTTASEYLPKIDLFDSAISEANGRKTNGVLSSGERERMLKMLSGEKTDDSKPNEDPRDKGELAEADVDHAALGLDPKKSKDVLHELHHHFTTIDTNHDGYVSADEVVKFTNSRNGLDMQSRQSAHRA